MGNWNRNWNDKLGNNFTDNNSVFHKQMMNDKNIETEGKYQASVSGAYGEFTIASVLKSLPSQFHLLNDYLIQTKKGSTQLDHIMVCPYGVIVIETKNHKGMIFGDMQGQVWTQVVIKGGAPNRNTFYSPVRQNDGHIKHLIKTTGLNPKYVSGVICFTNPEADLSNVSCPCCFTLEGLYQYFLALTNYPEILSKDAIYKIIKRLDETNINGYLNAEKHIEYVRSIQEKKEARKRGYRK